MRDIVCKQRDLLIVDLPQQGEGSTEFFGKHYAVAMNYSDIKCNTVLIVPLSSKKDNFINKIGIDKVLHFCIGAIIAFCVSNVFMLQEGIIGVYNIWFSIIGIIAVVILILGLCTFL